MVISQLLRMNAEMIKNTPSHPVDPSTQLENFNGTISIFLGHYLAKDWIFMYPYHAQIRFQIRFSVQGLMTAVGK
jgi:hypothetical protein